MPATSEKQKKFMDAAAHNPSFAKAAGVPQNVAKEFSDKSKGMTFKKDGAASQAARQSINQPKTNHGEQSLFSKGGKTMAHSDAKEDMKMDKAQDKAMIKKAFKQHDKQEHQGGVGTKLTLKKGGMTKMARGGGVESKGKTKGKMIAMCGGGKMK
jgi:hypothetical protein